MTKKKNLVRIPRKIAIIGVGMIGGSIACGLKKRLGSKVTISGSCKNPRRTKLALKLGIIDTLIDEKRRKLKDVDMIILATPILTLLKELKNLSKQIRNKCLVIDVGSTKRKACLQAEKYLDKNISFVGTHPRAGKENTGFENSDPNLFRNRPWVITPSERTEPEDIEIVKKIIKILGAIPKINKASLHDKQVSWASHLCLTLSSVIIGAVAKQKNWKEIAQIASTGFRDTTRLASFNPEIKNDIILTNKDNVLCTLDAIKEEIDNFKEMLLDGKNKQLFSYLQKTKEIRDKWLAKNFHS